MKPIETVYRGYRFRSRLEARWAVFFDSLGLRWEYEPEGFEFSDGTRYLPDFFVHWSAQKPARLKKFDAVGYWVEIKGRESSAKEDSKMQMLCANSKHHGYIFSGVPGGEQIKSFSSNGNAVMAKPFSCYSLSLTAIVMCCPERVVTDDALFDAIRAARSARFEFGDRQL